MNEGPSEPARELNVLSRDPLCAGAHLPNLDQWITPSNHFFVRNHFDIPNIDPTGWRLRVTGAVENELQLDYRSIRALPSTEVVCLLECAGNSRFTMVPPAEGVPWDHGAVSTARWIGVPLRHILEQAVPRSGAKHVLFEGSDYGKERSAPGVLAPTELHYAMSLPIEKALHPDTLLAYEMNGENLPPEHGFPVRLLAPGWYGMASVKWLANIQLLEDDFQGFHQNDYYVYVAEGDREGAVGQRVNAIRVKSLVTWPTRGGLVSTGTHTVRGVAWSGAGHIASVEVSTDDNRTWESAQVQEARSPYAWQHWEYQWEVSRPGYYLIRSRATDSQGNTQPLQAPWNFRGYAVNSIHAVPVTVRQ